MTSQTILLVDDDADLLQVVGARCRGLGLAVQHARNLLTATAVIGRSRPDLICVDVEMPTGNGLRFCESLAADPRTKGVPVIVLTGRKDPETMQKCTQLGLHYAFKSADMWTTLEPLVRRLLSEAAPPPRTTTGIRPRKLLAHLIPLWPGETDAGNYTAAETLGQERAAAEVTTVAASRKVIVADDDADLVEMLCGRLSSLGCSAIGVNTSLEAINAIHRARPDMVILDVNMPTGSGLSVCEMMATDEDLRMVPVIILTGCSDEKTIRRCHDMLVFYVQKGADVWSRIEPLVRELLHLGDASIEPRPAEAETAQQAEDHETRLEPMQAQVTKAAPAGEQATDEMPPASGGPINDDEASTLADAVFAMLGGGAQEEDSSGRAEAERPVIESPWILCIDDDFDFSDALKIRLDEYGIAVSRAADGMSGYWMAFSTRARAILLDYQMPNGQGDYILRRLKDNPVTRDIPVIMITGIKDKMLERRVMAMGAAAYMLKPVDFDELRRQLAKYIPALQMSGVRELAAAH